MPSDIIAIGGAAFTGEPRNLALDNYILEQTGKPHPRVLMIATARGDDAEYVSKFYAAYTSLEAHPHHLPLFERTPDVREVVMAHDVVFAGGGNTRSMLAVWREWGLPAVLREASATGIVLAGVSAGAICWFEQGVTDSSAGRLLPIDGLGFLPGSCCPHYDGEVERRPAYQSLLRQGKIRPGYAIEDGVALHFRNGRLLRAVTKYAAAKAYSVGLEAGHSVEQVLVPMRLS